MGKAFFSYNTATNEIPRAVYKENMQTLDCYELCSLVRDKIIISSPSRPNPQVACRIMIGVVLSHLFCIPLWHTAFQACQELHPQADRESSSCCHPDPAQVTSTPTHHCFKGTFYMINSLSPPAPNLLSFLYLLRKPLPPTHTCEGLKLSISHWRWLVASWALICWYKELSLARGALPGWVYLRSCCSSSELPDNLFVTSLGGCSKSAAIFCRRAGTYNIIKYIESVLIQRVETPG